jgi:hypothetical protein
MSNTPDSATTGNGTCSPRGFVFAVAVAVCARGRGLGTGRAGWSPPCSVTAEWVLTRRSPAVVAGRGPKPRAGCGAGATLDSSGAGVPGVEGADLARASGCCGSSRRAGNTCSGALSASAVPWTRGRESDGWLADCKGLGLYGGGLPGRCTLVFPSLVRGGTTVVNWLEGV